ncbi:uncharacterized protein LOC133819012 isoform X1 [Humulus lupulus]|uniref:uncharacterized protein LOC133819012 isoform X1 n=1 Tax=Humulus lupulus TaxID=3486 RepID=UPI002B415248|nr:uncharacterized protein LOC133819012 isoform X1 [Humulus lupulus]
MRGRDLDSAVESGINKGNVENLITQDVHNNVDDEELKIYGVNGGVVLMVFAQGNSHCFAYFKLAYRSLLVNGVDYSTISLEVMTAFPLLVIPHELGYVIFLVAQVMGLVLEAWESQRHGHMCMM